MARGKTRTVTDEAEVQTSASDKVPVVFTRNFVFFNNQFYHAGATLEVSPEEAALLIEADLAKEA